MCVLIYVYVCIDICIDGVNLSFLNCSFRLINILLNVLKYDIC